MPQQHADGIRVATERRPMQPSLSMVFELRGYVHTSLQQELDNVTAAILARPREPILYLLIRGVGPEPAIRVEKRLDDVQTADAGGGVHRGESDLTTFVRHPKPAIN